MDLYVFACGAIFSQKIYETTICDVICVLGLEENGHRTEETGTNAFSEKAISALALVRI